MQKERIFQEQLRQIFNEFEKDKIRYVILRGYLPLKELETSKDIDIFVHKDDKDKLENILFKFGWDCKKINTARYPHEFYTYVDGVNKVILDVVYGIYYGDKLFKFANEIEVFDKTRKIDYVYVPSPDTAITLFVLHIIFDKGSLSEQNKNRLNLMWEDYYEFRKQNANSIMDKALIPLIERVVKKDRLSNKDIDKLAKEILSTNILKYSPCRYFYRKGQNIFLRLANKFITILRNVFLNNNICILGVDGAGKSSVIKYLNEALGEKTRIQYMGFKEHKTWLAKWRFKQTSVKKKKNIFTKFLNLLIAFIEMWYRVVSNWSKDSVVIYDRYVWERFVNSEGSTKFIATVFFKFLFPKPKHIVYLHCPLEESFNRKNDIVDFEEFRIMKDRFDKEYLKSEAVISINTAEKDIESTLETIISSLPKDFGKYL